MKKMAMVVAGVLMLFAFSVKAQAQLISGWAENNVIMIKVNPWSNDPVGITITDDDGNRYIIPYKKNSKKYAKGGWVKEDYSNALLGKELTYEVPAPVSGCINYAAFQDDLRELYSHTTGKNLKETIVTKFNNDEEKAQISVIKNLNQKGNKEVRAEGTAGYYRNSSYDYGTICVETLPVCIINEYCDWEAGENETNCPQDCPPADCVLWSIEELSSTDTTRTRRYTFAGGIGVNGQLPYDLTPSDNGWGDIEMDGNTMTVTFSKGEQFRWSCFYKHCEGCARVYIDPIDTCQDEWLNNVIQWVEDDVCSNQFTDYY